MALDVLTASPFQERFKSIGGRTAQAVANAADGRRRRHQAIQRAGIPDEALTGRSQLLQKGPSCRLLLTTSGRFQRRQSRPGTDTPHLSPLAVRARQESLPIIT
eukprot:GFKZ01010456.1.p2 GENE.GFKZ01010456.1~~GFKZ01010456.1.p2  ORF type:complete len:104 (+),score=3.75 GFKZ01010456.1:276-587(+)